MTEDINIPDFCRVSKADRAAAWTKTPPKPWPQQAASTSSWEAIDATRRRASYDRIDKMLEDKRTAGLQWNTITQLWEEPPGAEPTKVLARAPKRQQRAKVSQRAKKKPRAKRLKSIRKR